jgi:predicted ATPase/DNA-binding CsgD family transcriptional regulator
LSAPLFERDAVLAEMQERLTAAVGGAGQIVLLRGEAGVGRTAVLRAFLATVNHGAQPLVGFCDPLTAPRSLGPLIDMVDRLPGPHAERLEAAINSGGIESVYHRLLDVLRDGQSRVFVIEDAHWADESTLNLLRYLARRIDTLPVLVVVSYRDFELGQGHPLAVMLGDMSNNASLTRISLSPLSVEAVREMANGSGVDPGHLHSLTGGNPFYLSEILAAKTGAKAEPLPRSVVESAWGRLARLSASARETAEVAAVCGPDIDPGLVEKLCPGASAHLNDCVRAGLLVATHDVVRFRHELVRLATLEQIPHYVRRDLQRRARSERREHPPDRVRFEGSSDRGPVTTPVATTHTPHLTVRELEILELLAVGHSDAQIATRLFISQRTVNNHVHAILTKLGVQNRTQAASFARLRTSGTTEPGSASV